MSDGNGNFDIEALLSDPVINDIYVSKLLDVAATQEAREIERSTQVEVERGLTTHRDGVLYQVALDGVTYYLDPPFQPKTLAIQNFSAAAVTLTFDGGETLSCPAGLTFPFMPPVTRRLKVKSQTNDSGYFAIICYPYMIDPVSFNAGVSAGASVVTIGAGTALIGHVQLADGTTATQLLAIDANGRIGINNFPATQPISGAVSVSNFPATQPVSIAALLENVNGDLRTAERAAANVAYGTLTTTGVAAQLLAARAGRRSVLIVNETTNQTCRIGNASVVAAAGNGTLLAASASVVLQGQDAISAISVSGACVLSYREEYDT